MSFLNVSVLKKVLYITRVPVAALCVGVLVIFSPPAQYGLVADKEYFRALPGCLAWAWSVWYWSATLLEMRHSPIATGETEEAWRWYKAFFPRLLGLAAFLFLPFTIYREEGLSGPAIAVSAFAIVVFVIMPILKSWARKRRLNKVKNNIDGDDYKIKYLGRKSRRKAETRKLFSPASKFILFIGAMLFTWGVVDPLSMGNLTDPYILLVLWGIVVLPVAAGATYVGLKTRFPVFTVIIALAFIFSLTNDNHQIRKLSGFDISERTTFKNAIDSWMVFHSCAPPSSKPCPPFVVVAAAGGGMRAAYWTATTLGALDDEIGLTFRDSLFAISGVSGGSVGAAIYRGIIDSEIHENGVRTIAQEVLRRDLLAPLLAGLLYPDFVQRFIPIPVLPDRAQAFEEALAEAFETVVGEDRLNRSFVELTSAEKQKTWPALFLNATWSENGRRLVAAGFDMREENAVHADFLRLFNHDIRLSTAAHNSARFPYLSPPGTWAIKQPDRSFQSSTEDQIQRLQDGGFFENYGAETAIEILDSASRHFDRYQIPFRPLVLLITSDPSLPANLDDFTTSTSSGFGYETTTSAKTIAAAREGRGVEAAIRLKNRVKHYYSGESSTLATDDSLPFFHFRMCTEGLSPPLTWSLSHGAIRQIESYLFDYTRTGNKLPDAVCRDENQRTLEHIRAKFSSRSKDAIPGSSPRAAQ